MRLRNIFDMKKCIILIVMVLAFAASSHAQSVAKAKAMLTLNFIRYVGWSDAARQGDFVIGVIKDKEIADWLKTQSAGKKFGFQTVVIKEFKSVDELQDCQVVYVSSNVNYSRNAEAIAAKTKNKDTLIITETEGATKNGSMINFVVREERLKFELHKKNAADSNIQFSAKLEQMTAAINL